MAPSSRCCSFVKILQSLARIRVSVFKMLSPIQVLSSLRHVLFQFWPWKHLLGIVVDPYILFHMFFKVAYFCSSRYVCLSLPYSFTFVLVRTSVAFFVKWDVWPSCTFVDQTFKHFLNWQCMPKTDKNCCPKIKTQ